MPKEWDGMILYTTEKVPRLTHSLQRRPAFFQCAVRDHAVGSVLVRQQGKHTKVSVLYRTYNYPHSTRSHTASVDQHSSSVGSVTTLLGLFWSGIEAKYLNEFTKHIKIHIPHTYIVDQQSKYIASLRSVSTLFWILQITFFKIYSLKFTELISQFVLSVTDP